MRKRNRASVTHKHAGRAKPPCGLTRRFRISCIFFLNTPEPDQEALEIMREQAAVGVEVYYIPTSELPKELTQLYFIGANRIIAWRVTIDNLTKVNEVKTTIRKEDVEAYRRNFRRILDLKSTRKFELAKK